MQDAKPPTRAPHYGDNETHGWSLHQCAKNLISTFCGWCKKPYAFKGAASGQVWHVEGDFTDRAQLRFTSDTGDGVIDLNVDETHWVRAEVTVGGMVVFRAWFDEAYEEKEFYPDGSDGEPNAEGDAPGRISKRGAWLQIRCVDFPGAPDQGNGYWDLEDTFD